MYVTENLFAVLKHTHICSTISADAAAFSNGVCDPFRLPTVTILRFIREQRKACLWCEIGVWHTFVAHSAVSHHLGREHGMCACGRGPSFSALGPSKLLFCIRAFFVHVSQCDSIFSAFKKCKTAAGRSMEHTSCHLKRRKYGTNCCFLTSIFRK